MSSKEPGSDKTKESSEAFIQTAAERQIMSHVQMREDLSRGTVEERRARVAIIMEYLEKIKKNPFWVYKEIAHKLGISEILTAEGGKKKDIFASSSPIVAHSWLADSFKSHYQRLSSRTPNHPGIKFFKQLETSFNNAADVVCFPEKYAEAYVNGMEILDIPASWPGHALGLTLVDDRLILTNTGEGATPQTSGTRICKIKDKKLITADFIRTVMMAKSIPEFMKAIASVVEDGSAIFIPAKKQKRGSCAVSNPKKNLKGILACLMAKEKFGNLDTSSIQQCIPLTAPMYKEYSDITLRDDALAKLIFECNTLFQNADQNPLNPILLAGVVKLMLNFMTEHGIPHKKHGKDIQRAKQLFESIPGPFQDILKQKLDPGLLNLILHYNPKAHTISQTKPDDKKTQADKTPSPPQTVQVEPEKREETTPPVKPPLDWR